MKKILLLLCTALIFAGCAAPQAHLQPITVDDEGSGATAEVVVIRDMSYYLKDFNGNVDPWVVAIDGNSVAELWMGEYTTFRVEAGRSHTVTIRRWDTWWQDVDEKWIPLKGEKYYFLSSAGTFAVKISRLPPEQGKVWTDHSKFRPVGR